PRLAPGPGPLGALRARVGRDKRAHKGRLSAALAETEWVFLGACPWNRLRPSIRRFYPPRPGPALGVALAGARRTLDKIVMSCNNRNKGWGVYRPGGDTQMTQRQLNMTQSIIEGLELARQDFGGPGGHRKMMEVLQDTLYAEDYRAYSVGHLAYLAAAMLAWKDAGSPDFS
ncbi:MAG: hypothetical protein IJV82_04950, partial [Oscillospiraceae bacterium]|nr:hypothetical protein [Oscillospiraceae bacterium]